MAIAFVQAWGGALPNNGTHGDSVSSVTTGTITTTSGNFIVAGLSYTALSSFSDSKTNTWTTGVGPIANGGDSNLQKYAFNISGGTLHTLTANLGAAGNYCSICAVEYSGLTTTDPLDKSNTGTGTSGSLDTTATATTSQADELLIGSGTQNLSANNVWTAGASFTKRSEINLGATTSVGYLEERIVSATGAYSAPMGSDKTTAWAAAIATYKAAGGGGGPTTFLKDMIGLDFVPRKR